MPLSLQKPVYPEPSLPLIAKTAVLLNDNQGTIIVKNSGFMLGGTTSMVYSLRFSYSVHDFVCTYTHIYIQNLSKGA